MTRNIIPGTQIEVIRERELGRFKHALFDFDGTISLLREGWQDVMAPVMLECIAGDTEPTPEMEQAVRDYIEESTGINTILQMEHLVQMVKEFGRVPEEKILDAHGYKKIYNDRLMKVVNERIARLERGEIALQDVTLRGAVEFVERLHKRGLHMYVFSGTDQPDVRHEAELVGVATYFEEIRGALRTYAESNKEKIIKELISKHDLHGVEVLVVGDGPVEIRHGREHDCVTVGVASNELTGCGWNERKRERLIKAGADILVPDFSEAALLEAYLFPKS
ncbi:MAG TPA: HAD hydrolase-like protein [Candidatus Hydrogenedentes bacterium]|nr:HAD hydrolase-like protein [Candidatus Hydrogenedentota bacterium]HOL78009.1 HAD hydrolase-like protein [Candidatus Hydrogenedentota bacterium]HPO87071.1 HAD hydrolase-like protein [Candidatus Hydrogenedentota bacterium]